MDIPATIKTDIKEYVRIDDGLKDARLQMKETRTAMNEAGERIIDFMRTSEVEKLDLFKGEQALILKEKELKIRPSKEEVRAKLAEAIERGIKDPDTIMDMINSCAGTKKVWKLSRRKKNASKGRKKKVQA